METRWQSVIKPLICIHGGGAQHLSFLQRTRKKVATGSGGKTGRNHICYNMLRSWSCAGRAHTHTRCASLSTLNKVKKSHAAGNGMSPKTQRKVSIFALLVPSSRSQWVQSVKCFDLCLWLTKTLIGNVYEFLVENVQKWTIVSHRMWINSSFARTMSIYCFAVSYQS